jgi:hypothetical protein
MDPRRCEELVAAWYALNADVTRVWVFDSEKSASGAAGGVRVFVTLAPVCDSDDVEPIWLARCKRWQNELERLMGRTVHLDRSEGEVEYAPFGDDPQRFACLAAIRWRYIE